MSSNNWIITRREFLKASVNVTLGFCLAPTLGFGNYNRKASLICSFGILSDPHYANITPRGSRYYPQSLEKMEECVDLMNEKKVDFMIELGDFTNGTHDDTTKHLEKIESVYKKFDGPRYHVLGNHDLDSLSKAKCQSVIENTGISKDLTYYSFNYNGIHFIVLDANFNSGGTPYNSGNFDWTDTNIPQFQLNWLKSDLEDTKLPTIVFVHQLLDSGKSESKDYYVNNASEIRDVLERNSKVLTVFQGHQHKGQYNLINDIHYYTLKAMVEGSGEENNSYAIVDIFNDNILSVTGYRKASSLIRNS